MKNIKYRCIKSKCPKYLSSDIFETCQIADDYCVDGKCIGFDLINDKIEKIGSKIAILTNELNKLQSLGKTIKINQNIKINLEEI